MTDLRWFWLGLFPSIMVAILSTLVFMSADEIWENLGGVVLAVIAVGWLMKLGKSVLLWCRNKWKQHKQKKAKHQILICELIRFCKSQQLTHREVVEKLSHFLHQNERKLPSDINKIKKLVKQLTETKTNSRFQEVLKQSSLLTEEQQTTLDSLWEKIEKETELLNNSNIWRIIEEWHAPLKLAMDAVFAEDIWEPIETTDGDFSVKLEAMACLHDIKRRHLVATQHYSPNFFGIVETSNEFDRSTPKRKQHLALGKFILGLFIEDLETYCRQQIS